MYLYKHIVCLTGRPALDIRHVAVGAHIGRRVLTGCLVHLFLRYYPVGGIDDLSRFHIDQPQAQPEIGTDLADAARQEIVDCFYLPRLEGAGKSYSIGPLLYSF